MKNMNVIMDIGQQVLKTAEKVQTLASGIQSIKELDDFEETYEAILYDEVEHLQILTLELTKALTDADQLNADDGGGSAFFAGELTSENTGDEE
jgi:hypothetical protein